MNEAQVEIVNDGAKKKPAYQEGLVANGLSLLPTAQNDNSVGRSDVFTFCITLVVKWKS